MGHTYNYCIIAFAIIFTGAGFAAHGLKSDDRKYCCTVGTNYSLNGMDCNSFRPPINGIEKVDETPCLHFIDVCCKNQFKEKQCKLGRDDARYGTGCSSNEDSERKTCCEACQMGLETGKSGESCQDTLGLSAPYDKSFIACCENLSTTLPTTTPTTVTKNPDTKPTSQLLRATKASNKDPYPLPSMESLCDSGEVCAQICEPTQDSYKCSCLKGYILMEDGISCRPEKRVLKKGGRCEINNPCEQDCIDTGTAIKCSCRDGYSLSPDKRTCKDVDECILGTHECTPNEECINEVGSYACYDPSSLLETDEDISYDSSKCPSGYKFNAERNVCDDIDECQFEITCPRPKTCKNTLGSFTCEGEDRPQCPPGFYYKAATESCSDIDECVTGDNDCNKESQFCLNTKGNYTCVDKASRNSCPPGFKKNTFTQACDDINECQENANLCKFGEECVNESGGYNCVASSGRPAYTSAAPSTTTSRPTTTITTTKRVYTTPVFRPVSCPPGYQYSAQANACNDIDECQRDPEACDSNQQCINTPGSFVCQCRIGFTKDYTTGACVDINECQVGTHDCTVAERCDNTLGSFHCARITGCGTGYTLNGGNGLCEDDDECVLGTHNCNELGPNYRCRNLLGSYRCEAVRLSTRFFPTATTRFFPTATTRFFPTATTRIVYPVRPQPTFQNFPMISGELKKCLPGYLMNAKGECEDVNECESNPCGKGQKCVNFNGRYQCTSPMQCTIGYELNDEGNKCVDVNECSRGVHKCNPTQICKNGVGYYTCDCPPGHHLSKKTLMCEDMDECKMFKPCGSNTDCMNTVGSYKCNCKEGFRKILNECRDIDECGETSGLCEQTCVNIHGSYRCHCALGFTLNYDNRTCTDIDECERFKSKNLCIGTCKNVPGSYACECPRGYKLGNDGRVCIDIDECAQNVCGPEDICLNTRGSYKCYNIQCPPNYIKDPEHKARCKRPHTLCDPRDYQCMMLPEQYTYQYMTLVSNLPLSDGHIQLFQIKGPQFPTARADFTMTLEDVNCPYGIDKANERFFRKQYQGFNRMQLYMVRSIQGPQEIKLKIEMRLFQGNIMIGNVVVYLIVVVSEYQF